MSNSWAPVIIQMGQASGYADFAAFRTSVIANSLTFSSNILNYTSEAGDVFTVYANSKTTPQVNGTTVNLNPAKTYDSPYLSMTHGTDLATVSYPGYQNLLLNFDPASTSFMTVNASTGRYQSTAQTTNTITTFTVPSGSNRKLVLFASWESGNRGISATWNGTQNFTAAINSASDRNAAILYLDAPTAGTGNIVVTFPGNATSRIGVLSLVGVAPGVARTSRASGRSGSLNHPVDGSFVAGVYTSNGSPTIDGPFSTTLYNGDSGSCEGNAGYQVMLAEGTANYTWSVSAPSADSHALAAFVPASAAPVMLSTSPADNATGVAIAANLVATFSEPIVKGTGTITIKRTSNNTTVESFNVATSSALTFSGQTLTINPTANLDYLTEYYVLFDAAAIIDNSGGNAFAGISSSSAWSFTAAAPPVSTFSSWISSPAFGLAVADRDLADDPDGDGIDNGVENVFGTHPGAFTQGLAAGVRSGNSFTFTHPQNASPATDLTASYRWSTDLSTFHLGGGTSGGTTVTFTSEVNTPTPGFTRVIATAAGTIPTRLFVDVRVTSP
jgi:methionine-rich copper-binding protein CopC